MISNATTNRSARIQTAVHGENGVLGIGLKEASTFLRTFKPLLREPKRFVRATALTLTLTIPLGLGACSNGIAYNELRDRNGNVTGVAISPTAPVWVTGRPGHQVINAAPYNTPYLYSYGYPAFQQLGPTQSYAIYRGMIQSGQIPSTCGYYVFLNSNCQ